MRLIIEHADFTEVFNEDAFGPESPTLISFQVQEDEWTEVDGRHVRVIKKAKLLSAAIDTRTKGTDNGHKVQQ